MALSDNGHLDDIQIESYSMGTVPAEAVDSIDEHLLICEYCRDRVARSDEYVRSMQTAAARIRDREKGWSGWIPRLPIPLLGVLTAGVVIAAVVGARWLNRLPVATAAISLTATRGSELSPTAPSQRLLQLSLDTAGVSAGPSFVVEVVDSVGKRIWQGDVHVDGATVAATVPPLSPGLYFVRLYSPAQNLLREYGLNVK